MKSKGAENNYDQDLPGSYIYNDLVWDVIEEPWEKYKKQADNHFK